VQIALVLFAAAIAAAIDDLFKVLPSVKLEQFSWLRSLENQRLEQQRLEKLQRERMGVTEAND